MSGPTGAVVNARILYWGVAGAGKSANLEYIHGKLRPDHRGDLSRIPTPEDPGVCYEVMPIELGEISGVRTRLQVIAPPGDAEHAATRKQLLDQVDGVVFVIDARRERLGENLASLEELRDLLGSYGRRLDEIPVVLQYNHRDGADDLAVEELHRKIGLRAAAFEAIAPRGIGVLASLTTISKRVVRNRREAAGLTQPPGSVTPEPASAAEAIAPGPAGLERVAQAADAESTLPEEHTLPEERTLPEDDKPPDSIAQAMDAAARRAERIFEDHWEQATGGLEARTGTAGALDLRVVAAEAPVVESDRRVRITLRVVDGEGREGDLALTVDLGDLGTD